MDWIVEPEYIACITIAIILTYSLREHAVSLLKLRVFRTALVVSLIAILVNIASIYAIRAAKTVPILINELINSLYFAVTPLMLTAIFAYAAVLLFEDRYRERALWYLLGTLFAVYTVSLVITLVNPRTHWLYWFDDAYNYLRGPLNNLLYLAFLADLAALIVACLVQRRHISRSFVRVVHMIAPMAVVLGFLQVVLMPDTMLSGTVAALALLVLFINGQQQQVNTDHLTELANREAFFHLLSMYVDRSKPFRVLIVSLRDYKSVNNRFGQLNGDRFLQEIGRYIFSLGQGGMTCRYSGVEFALIIPYADREAYETWLGRVIERFAQPWRIADGCETTVRACFADIAFPEHAADVNELVSSLEYAVRMAKIAESHDPVRFDKQLKSELGRRNYIIGLLRPALDNDRFFVNFQPIFDCREGRIVGAETLLRLRAEDGQLVPPGEFIPLAEEIGLIGELSWLVLEKACAFLDAHRDIGVDWLSINISAEQFQSREIVERVFDALERYDLQPYALKLEITERLLLEDIALARSVVCALKEGGVGVCLDDFGTGYSNLSNVATLPFECVKIDKSFIDQIENEERAFSLFEAVVQGLRSLDVDVLAEGVETAGQNKIVRMLLVDMMQGYYYARPLSEEAFVARMLEQ